MHCVTVVGEVLSSQIQWYIEIVADIEGSIGYHMLHLAVGTLLSLHHCFASRCFLLWRRSTHSELRLYSLKPLRLCCNVLFWQYVALLLARAFGSGSASSCSAISIKES